MFRLKTREATGVNTLWGLIAGVIHTAIHKQ